MTLTRNRVLATLATLPLVAAGAALVESGGTHAAAAGGRTSAPAFLVAAPAVHGKVVTPRSVSGSHRLVGLRTSLLPRTATGQRLGLRLSGREATARITHVEHHRGYTAWTGPLDVALGSFTLVRVGPVYRGSITSPQGTYAITTAPTGQFWLTHVAAWRGSSAYDVLVPPTRTAWAARARLELAREAAVAGRKHSKKAKIDVLIGYTKRAKQKAGGGRQIHADAALAITDTNEALHNSHIAVRMRLHGVVKTTSKETTNVFTDLKRLGRPHDGHFDNLIRARARKHDDIVHLLTGGSKYKLCGAGYEPTRVRYARPYLGASVSFDSCLQYLVATHEMGHNMGADHLKYHGISHYSKLPFAYAHINIKGRYLTAMGYYDPCEIKKIYDCQRIPYYSSPKGHYHGGSLGNHHQNNAKAIRLIAPLVARYAHR